MSRYLILDEIPKALNCFCKHQMFFDIPRMPRAFMLNHVRERIACSKWSKAICCGGCEAMRDRMEEYRSNLFLLDVR